MKHEKAILELLNEGKSFSFIQAQLNVYPSMVATVVRKYFEPSEPHYGKGAKRKLNEFGELELEAIQLMKKIKAS